MIEIKTFKDYLRGYGIPYAYNKAYLYVYGTTCGDPCFWQFTIKCGIITDCCMLYEMPDLPVKICYDPRRWPWSRRLDEVKCGKIRKLIHTSYNHTVEQMIVVC